MAEWSMATDCKSVSIHSRWFESNFSHLMVLKLTKKNKSTHKSLLRKVWQPTITGLTEPQTPNLFFNEYWNRRDGNFIKAYSQLKDPLFRLNHKPIFKSTNPQTYKVLNVLLMSLINTYKVFFAKPVVEFFFLKRNAEKHMVNSFYFLNFKFKRSLFFINIYNNVNKNYLSLSLGLFLKFFNKKKAFKKNKTLKLLTMRFLRKLFISLTFKNLYLRVRGVPVMLTKLLTTLNKPIIHQFTDPLSNVLIDETSHEYKTTRLTKPLLLTPFIYFTKNKSYTYLKSKKRGRVKRKIRRKLVKLNNVID